MTETTTSLLSERKFGNWLLTYLGPVTWWFKEHWIFAGATFVAVASSPVLLYFVPKQADGTNQSWVTILIIFLTVVGGAAVLGDKLADRFESKTSDAVARDRDDAEVQAIDAIDEALRHGINEINWLLERALNVPFEKGATRLALIEVLREDIVKAVAGAIGPGTRATYYRLEKSDSKGDRMLVDPKHALTLGRSDRPDRHWVERENPNHAIWMMLDRSDTEPQILRDGEEASGLDWSKVSYRCFISIPVKAKSATFGLLSVNSSEVGAIQETEKALIVTAARVLALAEGMSQGPENVRKLLALSDLSIRLQTEDLEVDRE